MNDLLTIILAAFVAQLPAFIGLFILWSKSTVNAHDIKNAAQKVIVDNTVVDAENKALITKLASTAIDQSQQLLKQAEHIHELDLAMLAKSESEKASVGQIAALATTLDLAYKEITDLKETLKSQGSLLQLAYNEITRLVTQKAELDGKPIVTTPTNDLSTQSAAFASQPADILSALTVTATPVEPVAAPESV